MQILAEVDLSQDGNDCYIYESYQLVRVFGELKMLYLYRATGWSPVELQVTVCKSEGDVFQKLLEKAGID